MRFLVVLFLVLAFGFIFSILPPTSSAEGWEANSDGFVTITVNKASEIPPMPAIFASAVAGHKRFGIFFPSKGEVVPEIILFVWEDFARGDTLLLGEARSLNDQIRGVRTVLDGLHKKGFPLESIHFQMDPKAKEPYVSRGSEGRFVVYSDFSKSEQTVSVIEALAPRWEEEWGRAQPALDPPE